MKEDSPTVMFGKKTSETKMTLWNMKEGSNGNCGNDWSDALQQIRTFNADLDSGFNVDSDSDSDFNVDSYLGFNVDSNLGFNVRRFAHCDVCNKYSRNKDDLVEHMRTVHEGRFAHCDVWKEDF